jgi:hypothetical protein
VRLQVQLSVEYFCLEYKILAIIMPVSTVPLAAAPANHPISSVLKVFASVSAT